MNARILYLSVVAIIAICSCQKKIKTSNVHTDPLTHQTDFKRDTIMKKETASTIEVIEGNAVVLQIEPKVFKEGPIVNAKLKLTNNLEVRIFTGEHYDIEYYDKGGWKRVTAFDELVTIDIGYYIAQAASRVFDIKLNVIPYNFGSGKYRITKGFNISDKKEIFVSTEFIVE